jgi:hypothetical protein
LVCYVLGSFLAYVVWSQQPGLRIPPPVGYLAAAAFLAAGATLVLQVRGAQRGQRFTAFLLVAALAGVGGSIGFGPGSRHGESGGDFLSFITGQYPCRVAFGAGAVRRGLIALFILRQ